MKAGTALLIISCITALIISWTLFDVHAQGPTVSPMYTLSIERLDFAATDQQVLFQTNVPARSNFVEVFRNGLLQTTAIDYSTASITGHLTVTFLQPLGVGERVTLIYWR
jgi:hypothetical protein